MTHRIAFKPAARREYDDACDWHEEQTAGLGDRFEAAVTKALDLIAQNPSLHPMIYRDIRAQKVEGFRYVILFRVRKEIVTVIAVFHTSRDPRVWQRRV